MLAIVGFVAVVSVVIGLALDPGKTARPPIPIPVPSSSPSPPLVPEGSTQPPGSRLKSGALVVTQGGGIAPLSVAGGRRYLDWEMGPLEESSAGATLVERELRTGQTAVLALNVDPAFGIASTADWVIYVSSAGGSQKLVAIRHGGSQRITLDDAAPLSPLAASGELVAWAREVGERQQVVVFDMKSQRRWVATDMPRCVGQDCYRIDAVTLADEGVVFSRGAVGSQPSFIVRRGFSAREPETTELPNDPQPDLVPSSSGAVFYWLLHGWYRWDFGSARPQRIVTPGNSRSTPLVSEDGRLFQLIQTGGCRSRIVVRRGRHRTTVIAAPSRLHNLTQRQHGVLCASLNGLSWTGDQVLSAWTLLPRSSEHADTDEGLIGLVFASKRVE